MHSVNVSLTSSESDRKALEGSNAGRAVAVKMKKFDNLYVPLQKPRLTDLK